MLRVKLDTLSWWCDAATIQDDDVVAGPFDFTHEVRREDDADAKVAAGPFDEVKHLLTPARIESGGRLIKQHKAGVMDDGLRELYALFHSCGVFADAAVTGFIEADVAHGIGGACAGLGGGAGR